MLGPQHIPATLSLNLLYFRMWLKDMPFSPSSDGVAGSETEASHGIVKWMENILKSTLRMILPSAIQGGVGNGDKGRQAPQQQYTDGMIHTQLQSLYLSVSLY